MNTILITADALRPDHLRQYGYERETMPVVDRLLDEGTLYERVYANGAHTQLSVPSILTGKFNGLDQIQSGPTVASILRENGLATAGIHSNPVVTSDFGEIPGFSSFVDLQSNESVPVNHDTSESRMTLSEKYGKRAFEVITDNLQFLNWPDFVKSGYNWVRPSHWDHEPTLYDPAGEITRRAIDFIEGVTPDPFFLWIHYMEPHRPYGFSPEAPHFGDFNPNYREMIDLMASAGVDGELSAKEYRQFVDLYDSDIRYMSESIANLFDSLQRLGQWDQTAVIFTADHGEEFGEHGGYYHRNKPYQELLHVPLICRIPGGDGTRNSEARQLVDIAPTILDRHGIKHPAWFDGSALAVESSQPVFGYSYRERLSIAVIKDDWKLILTDGDEDELYNLRTDPGEVTSVSESHPDVIEQLRSCIPSEIRLLDQKIDHVQNDELAEDTKDQLADLGYIR